MVGHVNIPDETLVAVKLNADAGRWHHPFRTQKSLGPGKP